MKMRIWAALLAFVAAAICSRAAEYLTVGQTVTLNFPSEITSKTLAGKPACVSSRPSDVEIVSSTYSSVTIRARRAFTGSPCLINVRYYYRELFGGQIFQRVGSYDFRVFVEAAEPTGISVSPERIVFDGFTQSWVYATLYPDGSETSVRWTTSNSSVATVSGSGESAFITAVGPGNCRVTATTAGGLSASCYVEVPVREASRVELPSALALTVGQSRTLTPQVWPEGARTSFSWRSDRPDVAAVSSAGRVTALAEGTARITVTTDNGLSDDCAVTVSLPQLVLEVDPPGGVYAKGTKVTLRCPGAPGADIRYTTDGSEPTRSSARYAGALTVDRSFRLRARAWCDGYQPSQFVGGYYELPRAELTVTPADGTWRAGTLVRMDCAAEGAEIRYTTDGSEPTRSSALYKADAPPAIDRSMTLKARAWHDDYRPSLVVERTYTVADVWATGQYPALGDTASRYAVPSLTLNRTATPGERFGEITLTQEDREKDVGGNILAVSTPIAGQAVVSRDKLFFVPDEPLVTGTYRLSVPAGALAGESDGVNQMADMEFSVQENAWPVSFFGPMLVLKSDRTLWYWGRYPVSNGSWTKVGTPVKLMNNVKTAAAAGEAFAVVKPDGRLYTWGSNGGVLGLGHNDFVALPTLVETVDEVVAVSVSGTNMLVLRQDGTVWVCGSNRMGQLGNGAYGDDIVSNLLQRVAGLPTATSVNATWHGARALDVNGRLWSWGWGEYSGFESDSHILTPRQLMSNVRQVEGRSMQRNYAVKEDNSLWSWSSGRPEQIMTDVRSVDGENNHSMAIKTDGSLWVWGFNKHGEFGNGQTSWDYLLADEAVRVMDDVLDVQTVDHGLGGSSAAIKTDGSLWAWGSNESGGVGNGAEEDQLTPVKIMDGYTPVPAESLTLLQPALTLAAGARSVVQPCIAPASADAENLTFVVDRPDVASVSPRGVVEALRTGEAEVEVSLTTAGGERRKATCRIVVTEATGIAAPMSAARFARLADGVLRVGGLADGEEVRVYAADGQLLRAGRAAAGSWSAPLPACAFCIVKTGSGWSAKVAGTR